MQAPDDQARPLRGLVPLDVNGVRLHLRKLTGRDAARLKSEVLAADPADAAGYLRYCARVVSLAVVDPAGGRLLSEAEVAGLPGDVVDRIAGEACRLSGLPF